MAELTGAARSRLRRAAFAYVDAHGGEHLPIHDAAHIRNAIARFSQTDFEDVAAKESARRKILRAAASHGIEVSADSDVRRRAPRRA